MRLLVCGGRDYTDRALLFRVLDKVNAVRGPISEVIQGGARGADALARTWCDHRKIPVLSFRADWRKYGPAAGPIRNQQMIDQKRPDLVVWFPGGKGTDDMVKKAIDAGIDVFGASPLMARALLSGDGYDDR